MPRALAVALVLVVSTAVGGCGPEDEEAPTVTTATTVSQSTSPSDGGTAPVDGGATASTVGPADETSGPPFSGTATVSVPPSPHAYLKAVRASRHSGFDRVVFEFESSLPGYRIGYVDGPIVEDGSGDRVEVAGDAYVEVHMEAASGADLSGGGLRQTYTGPRRIDPDTVVVTEVVRASDFEANLDWVVGMRRRAPFRAFTLTGPPRLVVDVAHAG